MASEHGKGMSDDLLLKWNKDSGNFEITEEINELPQ